MNRTRKNDRDFVVEFIGLYREQRCLWDPESPDFNDSGKREHAFQIMENKYREARPGNRESLEKKIKYLTRQYYLAQKEEEEKGLPGASTCWFYNHMRFLPRLSYTGNRVDDLDEEDKRIGTSELQETDSARYSHQSPSTSNASVTLTSSSGVVNPHLKYIGTLAKQNVTSRLQACPSSTAVQSVPPPRKLPCASSYSTASVEKGKMSNFCCTPGTSGSQNTTEHPKIRSSSSFHSTASPSKRQRTCFNDYMSSSGEGSVFEPNALRNEENGTNEITECTASQTDRGQNAAVGSSHQQFPSYMDNHNPLMEFVRILKINKDECGLFGDLIAEKLRKFDAPTREVITSEILKLIDDKRRNCCQIRETIPSYCSVESLHYPSTPSTPPDSPPHQLSPEYSNE